MKRILMGFLLLMLCVGAVCACVVPTRLNVRAIDDSGNNLTGVVATPVYRTLPLVWHNFNPAHSTTGTNGLTLHNWDVQTGKTVQVGNAVLAGYNCTKGLSTRITTVAGQNTLVTVCTKNILPPTWDRSSLKFNDKTNTSCNLISAEFCNKGASMAGTTTYEVWYKASGNPKDGANVSSGVFPQLAAGACTTLTYDPGSAQGNYMFKVYQRPGHPGCGELWSEAIKYADSCVPEFGVMAASLAVLGALGGIILFRKH